MDFIELKVGLKKSAVGTTKEVEKEKECPFVSKHLVRDKIVLRKSKRKLQISNLLKQKGKEELMLQATCFLSPPSPLVSYFGNNENCKKEKNIPFSSRKRKMRRRKGREKTKGIYHSCQGERGGGQKSPPQFLLSHAGMEEKKMRGILLRLISSLCGEREREGA